MEGDGLLILAKGLSLHIILSAFISIHSTSKNLVLLLNTPSREALLLQKMLLNSQKFIILDNTTAAKSRRDFYLAGGILSVTSRILVVDMLNGVLPAHLVSGIIINHAHRMTETSTEAFILRLYRDHNKVGFIKALSDQPEAFVNGLWKLERSMKLLYQRQVFLWPRFHSMITEDIESSTKPILTELRIKMSRSMMDIQTGLMDCLDVTLAELRKAVTSVDIEEFTVENALFKSFDHLLRMHLDPIWYKMSARSKQLVSDLKLIRRLMSHDCVSFLLLLDSIIAENAAILNSSSAFFKGDQSQEHAWLQLNSAFLVLDCARKRVFGKSHSLVGRQIIEEGQLNLPDNIHLNLELQPKWRALLELIQEIEQDRISRSIKGQASGPVLIMVDDNRTCRQVSQLIQSISSPDTPQNESKDPSFHLFKSLLKHYFKTKAKINRVSKTQQSKEPVSTTKTNRGAQPPPHKRRRVRGGSNAGTRSIVEPVENFQEFIDEEEELLEEEDDALLFDPAWSGLMDPSSLIFVRPYTLSASQISGGASASGDEDFKLLQDIKPAYIIIYDPDLSFIRRVEIHQAIENQLQIKLYFLVYDHSIEEQQYLSMIRKEKDAFEKLIHQKAHMAVPIEQDGRQERTQEEEVLEKISHRKAGGQYHPSTKPINVIVDMREFRSSLPFLLHGGGLKVIPCTLEVGDYILSPNICVERKSLSDLISSFKDGRLYSQCEAMSTHYTRPVLLIEFEKSFHLGGLASNNAQLSDLQSKLVLLTLTFPKLFIIWSSSPSETANIFTELKLKEEEPNVNVAMRLGVESTEQLNSVYNVTPQDILRCLPGITTKNYRQVMNKTQNLASLFQLPIAELEELIGPEPARKLREFYEHNVLS